MKNLSRLLFLLLAPAICLADAKEEITNTAEDPFKILITGSLTPEGFLSIGKPISSLSQKEILRIHEPSIGETLSSQPGISSTSFGPGASRPVIRGQSRERVRVLSNGLENGDASAASDDHAVTLDPLTTERIDILRGPSSLIFGGQAIGGVVNIIDDSIAEQNIGKEFTGKANFTAGDSASNDLSGGAVLKGQAGSLNWYLSSSGRNTSDIEIPGFARSSALREADSAASGEEGESEEDEQRGTLENTDINNFGIKTGLSHVWEKGFVGIAVNYVNSDYGIPSGLEEGEEEGGEEEFVAIGSEEENVRIDLEQTRVETRGAVDLDHDYLDSLRFGLTYSDYEHDELEGDEVGTTFQRDAWEGRIILNHHYGDSVEGGLGLQLNYDDLSVNGAEAFVPTAENFNPALFLVEDYSINENLVFQIGGRYENTNIDPVAFSSQNFNLYSASTGLTWHNDSKEYSAGLTFSYAERAPNVAELFADGVHVAQQIFEVGDEDIDKESSVGAELVLRKLTGSTRGSLSAFVQNFNDFINLDPSGEDAEGFPVFEYENVDALFWGFEGQAEHDIYAKNGHLVTFKAGFDLVRAEDTDNNEDLPRITPVRTRVGLDYTYDILSSYIDVMFVEEQDDVAEFEIPTDSYAILNAGFNLRLFEEKERSVDFYMRATNLTDDEARVHTSFLKDIAPLRGRAFFAGLTTNF